MTKLVVDNGRIKRTPRRKPELTVIMGNKFVDRVHEVEVAVRNLQDAFGHMVDAREDAREVAEQLLQMYREAGAKFERYKPVEVDDARLVYP